MEQDVKNSGKRLLTVVVDSEKRQEDGHLTIVRLPLKVYGEGNRKGKGSKVVMMTKGYSALSELMTKHSCPKMLWTVTKILEKSNDNSFPLLYGDKQQRDRVSLSL